MGPSRAYVEESRRGHEVVVEGWRKAVEAAEAAQAGGYWPVHLNGEDNVLFVCGIIILLLTAICSYCAPPKCCQCINFRTCRGWINHSIIASRSRSAFRCYRWH